MCYLNCWSRVVNELCKHRMCAYNLSFNRGQRRPVYLTSVVTRYSVAHWVQPLLHCFIIWEVSAGVEHCAIINEHSHFWTEFIDEGHDPEELLTRSLWLRWLTIHHNCLPLCYVWFHGGITPWFLLTPVWPLLLEKQRLEPGEMFAIGLREGFCKVWYICGLCQWFSCM